ncbi:MULTISPECIES: aldehyde dehydrogenase family protein [unclassified Marinovum]|uniref:aldehyde dehydrogenase family protein n=1 Tax=unclassified Marinovum TaxID=2647166 RepID=UPI003EDBA79C
MTTYYQAFIANEFTDAAGGDRRPVRNPATGAVWAEVPECGPEDARRAIDAAEAARRDWAALPSVKRAEYIYRIAEALRTERDHFARLLVMEQGKPLAEAGAEVDDTIRYMTYAAEAARRIQGEILPSDLPNEQLFIYRVPLWHDAGHLRLQLSARPDRPQARAGAGDRQCHGDQTA